MVKVWPVEEPLVLVEAFHLGLSDGGLNWRRNCTGARVGLIGLKSCTMGEEHVTLGMLLGMALLKSVFPIRRCGGLLVYRLLGGLMEDAEELLGVSTRLLAIDCSEDNIVLIESRSCWFLRLTFMSSKVESSWRMSIWRLDHRRFMSDCRPRISPLTVRRSMAPRSTMAKTR